MLRNPDRTRNLLLVVLLLASFGESRANPEPPHLPAETCTLEIHATGFRNQKGVAAAVIFTSPNGWPEDDNKSYAHEAVPIVGTQATIPLHLPPGRYGVVVLHDENSNHKLDRNFLGIPKEGFGFANNPHVFLTAPPFHAATVHVACPTTAINVRMIYK